MNTGRTIREWYGSLSSSYSDVEIKEKLEYLINHNLLVGNTKKNEYYSIIKEFKVSIDENKMKIGIVLHGNIQDSMLLNMF